MKRLDQLSTEEMYALTNEVYERLSAATKDHLQAKQEEVELRRDLELLVSYSIFDGTIVGKNEKEREAAAHQLFPEQYAALDVARKRTWETETELQIAKIEEAQLTMGVRIFDLVSR